MTVKTDEPLSIIRQLELMRALQRLANERAQAESRAAAALDDGLRDAATARDATIHEAEDRNSIGRVNAQIEYEATRQAVQQRYELDRDKAQSSTRILRRDVESTSHRSCQATNEKQERSWEVQSVYDATKERPREQMLETEQRLNAIRAELAVLEQDSTAIMKMRRQWREFPPVDSQDVVPDADADAVHAAVEPTAPEADPVDAAVAIANARAADGPQAAMLKLYRQWLPKLFEDEFLLVPFLVAWAITAVPERKSLRLAPMAFVVAGERQAWPPWSRCCLRSWTSVAECGKRESWSKRSSARRGERVRYRAARDRSNPRFSGSSRRLLA